MMKRYLLGSALTAALLLVGCGSDSDSVETTVTTDTVAATTGYLVDSAVTNVDYDCITDNDLEKVTGIDGAFTCRNMNQVRFRLGELVLGEISSLSADGYVFPQDLAGVNRENITDERVTAMAQLLQSLDKDGNVSNGIQILEDTKTLLEDGDFIASNLSLYLEEASVHPAYIRTQTQAREHLRDTLQDLLGIAIEPDAHGSENGAQNGEEAGVIDINQYPVSSLTQELKDAIAYMGNEERLAYDIYMNLYNYHNENNNIQIMQFPNIANAEETHVGIVQSIVQKYDLGAEDLSNVDTAVADNSVSFEDMPSGVYDIPAIQELYDALYAKGITSQQDALEVGCMVEVTDINDLDEYIELAEESNAADVLDAFNILRDGSYSHYWSFDKGLKNMGVTDGCASLGEEYDHPEYPQNSNGNK